MAFKTGRCRFRRNSGKFSIIGSYSSASAAMKADKDKQNGCSGLANQRPASPCSSTWEKMAAGGTDKFRVCKKCSLYVYNFANMDQSEATKIVFQREGKTNPTFYQRTDGTYLTSDCPVALAKQKQDTLLAASISIAFLAGACLLTTIPRSSEKGATAAAARPTVWINKDKSGKSTATTAVMRPRPHMRINVPSDLYATQPLTIAPAVSPVQYVNNMQTRATATTATSPHRGTANVGAAPPMTPDSTSGQAGSEEDTATESGAANSSTGSQNTPANPQYVKNY
jgi:hypothetical protein